MKPNWNARFAYFRKMKGFTQQQICEAMGINRKTISWLETGKQKVTLDYAFEFTRIIGISMNEFCESQITIDI